MRQYTASVLQFESITLTLPIKSFMFLLYARR